MHQEVRWGAAMLALVAGQLVGATPAAAQARGAAASTGSIGQTAGSQAKASDADAQREATVQQLPEVVAEGDRAPEAYRVGSGLDAGTSRIERRQIEAATPGSGDVNQLLKALPGVQFTRREGLATREALQDLTPSRIAIAGGRFYENLFTVDGVDVASRLDVTQDQPFHFNEVTGATAQGLWLDANLIGAITLRDSNVSAEYGRFTGGTLDIETRAPAGRWGASATASYSGDALTHFKVSDASRKALGDKLPVRPSFDKWRYGMTLDVPVSQAVQMLFGYNRSRADVTYFRNANYGGKPFGQSSRSDNYLAKLTADLGGELRLTGQASYSPYRSEAASGAGIDNQITSHGGGLSTSLALEQRGTIEWSLTGSYTLSDNDREAPDTNYSIPSSVPNGAVCASTSCTRGGFGRLNQRQETAQVKARVATEFGALRLSGGVDFQHVDALRERPDTNYAYKSGKLGANIQCANGDSLTCVSGQYVLTERQIFSAYRAKVALDSYAAWAEAQLEKGPFTVRAGLRYDRETYLGNDNLAPRLSVVAALPWDGWSVTLGANRYFGRSMLAYALRDQYPDSLNETRAARLVGGKAVYDETWQISMASRPSLDIGGSTRTPYSDELSAALNGRVLGGRLSLRGIYRDGKDEFTRVAAGTATKLLANGKTVTFQRFRLANEGESRYRGLSAEWVRSFGKHSVALNLNWSKTRTRNDDYMVDVTDLTDGTQVVYQGTLRLLEEVEALNQREDFAAPLLVNASWTALWLADRVTTNVNLRYRNGFRRIEDTGNTTRIDGTRYAVYDWVRYPDAIDVNLNLTAEIVRTRWGTLGGELRISNLLDTVPARNSVLTSQPYQLGRAVWTGLSLKF